MGAKQITFIPAINKTVFVGTTTILQKKRVAAYARVSTDNEEQQNSYDAQVDYYTKKIEENPVWQMVSVYSDEGISATSTKNRTGFNRMIADALGGKIDLIITKSVSRFARNTVDTLTTVRQLKEKDVEVYFEKEQIFTMDSKGELLITIMSSLAQEESRSISENVTWGQRKRFADGKVNLPYGRFLGYEKGEDGLPKIIESEAEVIRLIYKLFLEGQTTTGIAKHLTIQEIPTPAGKQKWLASTVESILKNEKFCGCALLQKTYTIDFLTKKKKVNEGEIPQYFVKNSHPSIVSIEVYDLVQHEFEKRKTAKGYKTCNNIFSGKIVCGECGSFYGSKVWHSNSKYRRTIWQCNNKFKNAEKCSTHHITEEKLKQAFVDVFNGLVENKTEILKDYKNITKALTDTTEFDKESAELQSKMHVVTELLKKCVEENSNVTLDQTAYNERYSALVKRYEIAKSGLAQLNDKKLKDSAKKEDMAKFMQVLSLQQELMMEFDDELWNGTVEKVMVYDDRWAFGFKSGLEMEWIV